MANRSFNPLDPLGILEPVKQDLDKLARGVRPSLPGSSSSGGSSPRLPDPLGLFRRSNPGDPAGYAEWKAKLESGYGQYRPGVSQTQVEREIKSIPRDILTQYFREGLVKPSESKGTIGNPIPIEFDGALVGTKEQARRRLLEKGYPTGLVDKSLTWYEEWIMGMARRLAPGDTELQKRVVQAAYAEIAPRAEHWIRGIQEAFGIPAPA